jgi:glycosyltransferase involved in cell wall biosynthesis
MNSASNRVGPRLPGVFLMTDSFDTGGSERQFAALAGSLDAELFRVSIGCVTKRGRFLDGLGEVTEFPVGGNLYGAQSMQARLRLARHLRHLRISVAHAFDFYTNLTLIPAARLARIPVVIGSQRQLGDLLTPAKSRAQLAALAWCDRVVCNSRAAADRLIEQGIRETRIVVIRNGLPPRNFGPTVPALPRRSSLLRVGMIARMNTESKNHRIFLRAAARLRKTFPDLEFILVGDGPLRPEFERVARDLGILDCLHFLGDRQDIPAILASLDVSVLPSASESLSNVIIESMAAGIPVVAARVGGNPELITQSRGILVDSGDDEGLSAAIERLLHDAGMRTALGRNARIFAEMNFTIAEMKQRHEALYTDLLKNKRGNARNHMLAPENHPPNRLLRVAIVAPSLRYVGGQSVQADLLLANWQNDAAVEAKLIPIDPAFPYGFKWIEKIPFLRTLVREPLYLWSLWRGLKNVDIAHIFSASYWSFLLAPAPAWILARCHGIPTLIHYHSGEARDHLRRFRSARPVLQRADLLVVPSVYLVDVLHEFRLRALVVSNIVDFSQFSFRIREPIRPNLVCTRGFHPYYAVDVVVRAFAEIKRVYPEARLDLVGGGPLEAEIRGLVDDLKLRDVNFAGVAPHHKIAEFYDRADIFINGSCLDNVPVSILEAFASGTPVVSTAPEGIRRLVEHDRTGLLCEPGDLRGLAQNVIRLLQDPVVSSRIARNAHAESMRYCWKEVRGEWLKLYRSIAASTAH